METKTLLRKIKKEFPEINWESARKTKQNWDFDVVILDNMYVFRFAKDKGGEKRLANEIKLLDYLANKTLMPVPNYIFRSKSGKFAGYKILKGEKLALMEFRKLPYSVKKKMAVEFADFLNVLHGVSKRHFGNFGIETKSKGDEIEKLFGRLKRTAFPKLKKQETKDIANFFDQYDALIKKPYKRVLVHGDLTRENIIFENNKITGVIDFSNFGVNEPALDFKGFWGFGLGFVKMVYENYKDNGDNFFIERSRLYHRMIGLYVLDGTVSCKHSPLSFEKGYKLFRKYFYIK
ncbi:MAG: aminoglycoside phosphotransferase family protein [Candidatus Moraniibacteriota bacterium]